MPRESQAARSKRVLQMLNALKKEYPNAWCSLDFKNPLQLLISTILAAQCTDERVNIVAKDLFRKYKTAQDFADVSQEQLEEDVRSTGFFRNKAKNIRNAAARLVEHYGGQVPDTMDDLLSLAGVARKTANVVLGTAFGKNEGLVVDTHVTRLSNRLGLTTHENNQGDRIEKDLMKVVPREEWTMFSHLLVFHGRACCNARKPQCQSCCIATHCPSAGQFA